MKSNNEFEESPGFVYLGCVVGILLCLFSVIFLQRQFLLDVFTKAVSAEKEKYFGDLVFDLYRKELKVITDKKPQQELESIVARLKKNNDWQELSLRFHIVANDEVNAAAMLGGHIVINRGLIMKSENAEQLLAVVAHEVAHIENRDVLKMFFSHVGMSGFFNLLFGDANLVIENLALTSTKLLSLKYSREAELAADKKAVDILSNSGISCQAMIDFLAKSTAKKEGGGKMSSRAELLMTHPATANRIGELQEYIAGNNKCQQLKLLATDIKTLQRALSVSD